MILPRPWPPDRSPTASELLEFCRVTASDEVLPLLTALIQHAERGRTCLVADHDNFSREVELRNQAIVDEIHATRRARLAHAGARRRSEHWRRIAVELAAAHIIPRPGAAEARAIQLAAGAIALDGGRNAETSSIEHATGDGHVYRTVQTVDLLGAIDEPDHVHTYLPVPDGTLYGKPRWSNRCACGDWQNPYDPHGDEWTDPLLEADDGPPPPPERPEPLQPDPVVPTP